MPGFFDAALLTACAIIGAVGGHKLRLPAPIFLGPLNLAAATRLAGITEGLPPPDLVNAAQVALGTILGCRFFGIAPGTVLRRTSQPWGQLITLALAFVASLAMRHWAGVSLDQAMLALAPGGLTEMGLIALSIQADVAFVALHHVWRILVAIVVAPPLLRGFLAKR